MKKTVLRIAFVLCLTLLAVLLASCSFGKKKGESTDEAATTWDGHDWGEGEVIAAPTCSKTGTKLYICSICGEKKTEVLPTTDEHTIRKSDAARLVTPPTAATAGESVKYCSACGKAVSVETTLTYTEYSRQTAALKTEITGFSSSDFGDTTVRSNLGNNYTAPSVKPTKGQHPRVLFNQTNIANINAALEENRSSYARGEYLKVVTATPITGKLPASSARNNFNSDVLNQIQELALEYQLTKNQIAGYGAIRALLNHLKTMDFYSITSDQERQYGFTMYVAACVYDWCYDILTPTSRRLIVEGVQHFLEGTNTEGKANMEVGFPPTGQYSVAGHGCEFQILRDYLAFAIAIYDEYPGWWDFIAGRFYTEFVQPRNYYYEAGMVTQGASLYIRIRFVSDLYSAWLIKAATGTMPYNEAGMKQVMRTVYSYELPNNSAFAAGDDHLADGAFPDVGRLALISSYLFDDATVRAQLESHKTSYSRLGGYFTVEANVSEYLICSSNGVKAASDVHQDMDLILYNGGWLGQIIARNNWTASQVAVLMKIGVRTGGNHDHADAGSFQIWYKTMLAGDTGDYDSYGTSHWRDYHQATVAHNSILINGQGQTKRGGNEMSHRNYLTDSNTLIGEVLGVQYGYTDPATKTKPTYAYIAGDITPAYADKNSTSGSLASEVQRRMLAVYDTGNDDVPLYFFVFDNVKAKSSSYKKTFLLHVPAAPTISGKTATVQDNGAKLVLQNVIGTGVTVTGVGGAGNNYNVNGSQVWNDPQESDGFWGRIEVTTNSGSATDQMVNVIYVCDANKTPENVTAKEISNSTVKGASIGNVAAVFVTNKTRQSTGFSFTTEGSGTMTYYVSGVAAGKWTITSGGKPVTTLTATEEGGLLVFTAPAGTVNLVKN